ncbi:unnamed protein product [Kuraishia capsulata CBS 1993]|uniref:Porphobilinogen deaminase n=1 Tax=Kuraishia capsulata CBS 1993 TaxID=1382522 RepID=W6MMA0_9ASCO|nr:uncharacterized protein KUCA_T00003640001 [Kuraishia capsulata CBS 1993]CDK27661.1 unnamed protein product [Kuraishia capsulata CBS 1993]
MRAGSPYKSLAELPKGSIVGTSSVRRSAQLLKNYPHLQFKSVRGNIHTRLRKLDDADSDYSCLILAAAGLIRVDLGHRITECLNADTMYHAVGQGALGVEIRKNDPIVSKICQVLRDEESTVCCLAERSLLRFLEGGCSVPVGVSNSFDVERRTLNMTAIVLSPDGKQYVDSVLNRVVANDADAERFGEELGNMLIQKGAKKILDEINYDKIQEVKSHGLKNDDQKIA